MNCYKTTTAGGKTVWPHFVLQWYFNYKTFSYPIYLLHDSGLKFT